jgi:hypothetical protein
MSNHVINYVSTHVLIFRIIQITNKMLINVYDVFYSINSHQHVSAATAAIFRVILLQEYKVQK